MSRSNDNAVTTAVLALVSGAFLGAVAALLLAPAPGSETRQKLVGLQEDAGKRLRKYADEARGKIVKGKGTAEDLQYDGGDAWI